MIPVRAPDKTATLGLDQQYQPLHIKQITLESGDPCMQSLWRPEADELAALNAGGMVVLNVLGRVHPPVHLTAFATPPIETGEAEAKPTANEHKTTRPLQPKAEGQ